MITTRTAHYASRDQITTNAENRRAMQDQQDQIRAQDEENRKQECLEVIQAIEDSDDDGVDKATEDAENIISTPTTKRSHKRTVKTGTTIFIPHDVLKSPELVATSTRNKQCLQQYIP